MIEHERNLLALSSSTPPPPPAARPLPAQMPKELEIRFVFDSLRVHVVRRQLTFLTDILAGIESHLRVARYRATRPLLTKPASGSRGTAARTCAGGRGSRLSRCRPASAGGWHEWSWAADVALACRAW